MPKSLVAKIAKVCASVPELQKKGDNGEYTYLRASDIVHALRDKLLAAGIVIIPVAHEIEQSHPYETITGDIADQVTVKARYVMTDGIEKLEGAGAGVGQDYHGKAIYKAHTGALKYFLMTLGLIAGVEDDPENVNAAQVPEGLAEKLDAAEKTFGPDLREHPISQRDVRAFNSACMASKRSASQRKKYLQSTFGIESVSHLKRKDVQQALAWALGSEQQLQSDSQDAVEEETAKAY